MSIIIRAVLAGACALALATTATAGAAQSPAPSAAPPAATGVSGTYAGELTPDDGTPGGQGVVVLAETGDTLEVKLGESLEQLLTGTKVTRAGRTLRFEVDVPGPEPNHLAFEVVVDGTTMTGTVTQTRDGRTRTAKVAFIRQ